MTVTPTARPVPRRRRGVQRAGRRPRARGVGAVLLGVGGGEPGGRRRGLRACARRARVRVRPGATQARGPGGSTHSNPAGPLPPRLRTVHPEHQGVPFLHFLDPLRSWLARERASFSQVLPRPARAGVLVRVPERVLPGALALQPAPLAVLRWEGGGGRVGALTDVSSASSSSSPRAGPSSRGSCSTAPSSRAGCGPCVCGSLPIARKTPHWSRS
jgi:hypothetical protein